MRQAWRDLPVKKCSGCAAPFEFWCDDNHTLQSNITVDRLDNNLPHTKDNGQLLC